MIEKLNSHGITLVESFADGVSKLVKKKESNSIVFFVRIGYFATSISLLKVHKPVSEFKRQKLAEGSFSDIFFAWAGGKEYAVKSQRIKGKDRLAYTANLDSILQEYLLYKVAAVLGFGPQMERIFGYDLVCYNDRIEFAMELC